MLNEDGILLEGTWEQGALIGEGSARRWDEAGMPLWHYVGTWAQGMFAKGTVTYLPQGDSYEGEFFAKYTCGCGAQVDDDGYRLMHEEWELQRHGPGKYTDAAGRVVYDGLWERDWPGDWPSAGDKGSWVTEGMQEGFQRWVPDPDQPCAKRTNAEEALASRILELEERGMDRGGFALRLYCEAQLSKPEC